jgi:chaperonin GroEL (HSP60 family)
MYTTTSANDTTADHAERYLEFALCCCGNIVEKGHKVTKGGPICNIIAFNGLALYNTGPECENKMF